MSKAIMDGNRFPINNLLLSFRAYIFKIKVQLCTRQQQYALFVSRLQPLTNNFEGGKLLPPRIEIHIMAVTRAINTTPGLDTVPELRSVWERYEELKEIGEGSYGRYNFFIGPFFLFYMLCAQGYFGQESVYRKEMCHKANKGIDLVDVPDNCKQLGVQILGMTDKEKEEVKAEARILASLDHPNIIKLMDDRFALKLLS